MDLRFGKGVRKVVSVQTTDDGRQTATTLYQRKAPKKKSKLGPAEKVARAAGSGLKSLGEEYLAQHDKSSQQTEDGWLRDLPLNVFRATSKAGKKLQLLPVPVPYTITDSEDDDDGDDE